MSLKQSARLLLSCAAGLLTTAAIAVAQPAGSEAGPAPADPRDLSTPVDALLPEGIDFMADESKEELVLQLVVAVDVSNSIGDLHSPWRLTNEYELQKRGIVDALKDADVSFALETCAKTGIGLAYAEWSGGSENAREFRTAVPWRKIAGGGELAAFADDVGRVARSFHGWTDIVGALTESTRLILTSPFRSQRNIINVSGDGQQRAGPRLEHQTQHALLRRTRDRIVDAGVTINGLAIEDPSHSDRVGLGAYYESHIQGGYGSFTESVGSFEAYAAGLKSMLLRELRTCGV